MSNPSDYMTVREVLDSATRGTAQARTLAQLKLDTSCRYPVAVAHVAKLEGRHSAMELVRACSRAPMTLDDAADAVNAALAQARKPA